MVKKILLKDFDGNELLPITRGELILDPSGKMALRSTQYLATSTLPGLMSPEDRYKIDNMSASSVAHDLVLKIKSGTVEGTDLYTFNGSADKILDFQQGSGITLLPEANKMTISNSGVRAISESNVNGTISVNTNGTVANVSIKGLGSAAFTASSVYSVRQQLINEDLNNIITPGFYNAGSGNSVTNKPSNIDNFGLIVIHSATDSHYIQLLFKGEVVWRRHCISGEWSVWKKDECYNVVSSTSNGLTPMIGTESASTIGSQSNEWVLASTSGATPTWRKLPSNAFNNTTYTLSGALSAGGFTTTLTSSTGSTSTSTVPIMGGATSSASGSVGLVPAPSSNTAFLRGDGTWSTPLDTHYTTHLYIGATNSASNSSTINGNTYIKLFDNSTLRHQYKITGGGVTTVNSDSDGNLTISSSVKWSDISDKPSTFTPSTHNHPSSQITSLTGYSKATSPSDLSTTDTLNSALGKLEYKSDLTYDWYLSITQEDTDDIINKWGEIVDFIDSVAEGTDITDEFVTRKTAQTIIGAKSFSTVVNITGTSDFSEGIRLHHYGDLSSLWFGAVNNSGYDPGMWGITVNSNGMRFRGTSSITGTSASDYVNIIHGGNVGIGTTNPSHKLHVNGNILASKFIGTLNSTLTFSAGAFAAKTYDNSAAVTVNIPTHTSHLTNNSGFLTQHQSLANYVTLNTAQTITGVKTFTNNLILSNGSSTESPHLIFQRGTTTDEYYDYHIYSQDGKICFGYSYSGLSTYVEMAKIGYTGDITAIKFIKAGGTASQFLKADGSVDSNAYATISSLGNYLPLSGGTLQRNSPSVLIINNTNSSTSSGSQYSGVRFSWNGTVVSGIHGRNGSETLWRSNASFNNAYEIFDTGNYTSWVPKKDGTGASGTWGINITGNADTVDGFHASSLVKFYLSPMTSNAPADSAKSWFTNTMPSSSGAIVYNIPGSEKTIIAGKSSGAYGHMLQLNYDDTYLRILRYFSGNWKSTDWEKISAGYADQVSCTATTDNLTRPIVLTDTSNRLHYTTKATINYSTGNITTPGIVKTSSLVITSTTGNKHILFSRGSDTNYPYNYIAAPVGGLICILPNGVADTSDNGMQFSSSGLHPATNVAYSLGTSSLKWNAVYATSFHGALKGNADSASKLTTVSKTAWGQTYWTSGGVPTSISGNMTGVGAINMTGDIYITVGNTDHFLMFDYDADRTAGGSWRVGMLGSGFDNTNYFVIESGTSDASSTVWNRVLQLGQSSFEAVFASTVTSSGFIKSGSSDSYVLLGGGGHKTIASFQTTYDGRYVKKAGDTMTGTLTMYTTGTGNYNHGIRINRVKTTDWALILIGKSGKATEGTGTSTAGDGAWLIGTPASSNSLIFNLNNATESLGLCLKGHGNTDMKWNNNTVWHAGNDGSGSGLDADKLDGIHASGLFTNLSNSGNNISITIGGTNKTLTPAYATSAGNSTSVGDGTMVMYPQYNNEINFGGSNSSDVLYFGYRATGSRPIPSNFIFGGSKGTATLTAARLQSNGILYLNGVSGVYLQYNGADASSLVLSSTYFKPFDTANNKLSLGYSSARWSNVYSYFGNFADTVHIYASSTSNYTEGIRLYGTAKDSTFSIINFGCDPAATSGTHANQWLFGRDSSNRLVFRNNTIDQMYLTTTGLGIGVVPIQKLHVNGNAIATNFGVNSTAGSGQGISLYGGSDYVTTYGIMFATTGTYGVHGYVSGDWATYFTMSNTENRGWIFRRNGSGNVFSIDCDGHAFANGLVNASRFSSRAATGTQPYACTSTTCNTNLNADLLDGKHASAFAVSGHTHDYLPLSGGTMTGTIIHSGLEASGKRILYGDNRNSGFKYDYAGHECFMISAGTYANSSIAFYTGNRLSLNDSNGQWVDSSPDMHIKNGRVHINKIIANNSNATYNLDVNGSANATTLYENGTRVSVSGHTHSYLPLAGGTLSGHLSSNSGYTIVQPYGAQYNTNTSSVTGCITVVLPASIGATMVSMWIDVYVYRQQESFSVHCGGYTYNNSTWANSPFAIVYGANHRVRMGHNGTNFVIYIGETNTAWSYPQVSVRNVTLGYSPTLANWQKAWDVVFSTSVSNVTYDTTTYAWTTKNLTKSSIGLGNVQNTAFYQRTTTVNGTAWDMAGTNSTAAFTIYAPTTVGTDGYVLKSNGSGAPSWVAQSTLSVSYSASTGALGRADVGSATQPIYLDSGAPKACTAYASASVNYANSAGVASKVSGTLKFVAGSGFVASTYNGSANVSVNVPTSTSHLTNDNNFVHRSDSTSGVGNMTKPVYVTSTGLVSACTYGVASNVNGGQVNKLAYYGATNQIDDYTDSIGSATQPMYLNDGVPTACTYSLKATVNNGVSGRLAYYSGTNTITYYNSSFGNSYTPVYINAGKPAAISITANTSTLYVLGTITGGTIYKGGTSTSTGVHITSGSVLNAPGGFYETSDARLKNFISDINIDFDKLRTIPKKYFTWKNKNKVNIGTSAQELLKIYPEIVNEGEDGILTVAYDKLSIIALKAIDQLYDEILKLRQRIKTLEENK